jgi:transcription elongation factor Elf1
MAKNFTRNIENFSCANCGQKVTGNGYTNHCPTCLWSKHVDCNPGDRLNQCQGLLEPIGVKNKNSKYVLIHRCTSCGTVRNNKVSKQDNFDAILALPLLA